MRKPVVLLLVLLLLPLIPASTSKKPPASEDPLAVTNWLSGWKYRLLIKIDNVRYTTASEWQPENLTDYQILVTVDTASLIKQGKMRPDAGDIRFTDENGTLLPYWIESGINTSSTRIWVRIPYIPANSTRSIFMYYNNPSATSASNGEATFLFFDDFNGADLDRTKWTLGYGSYGPVSYSVSDGLLKVWSPDGTWRAMHANFPVNYSTGIYKVAVEAKVRIEGTDQFQHYLEFLPTDNSSMEFGVFEDGTDSDVYSCVSLRYPGVSGQNLVKFLMRSGSCSLVSDPHVDVGNNWHIVSMAKYAASYAFRANIYDENRTRWLGQAGGATGGPPYPSLWAFALRTRSSSPIIYDWVFIRKFAKMAAYDNGTHVELKPKIVVVPPAWEKTDHIYANRSYKYTYPFFEGQDSGIPVKAYYTTYRPANTSAHVGLPLYLQASVHVINEDHLLHQTFTNVIVNVSAPPTGFVLLNASNFTVPSVVYGYPVPYKIFAKGVGVYEKSKNLSLGHATYVITVNSSFVKDVPVVYKLSEPPNWSIRTSYYITVDKKTTGFVFDPNNLTLNISTAFSYSSLEVGDHVVEIHYSLNQTPVVAPVSGFPLKYLLYLLGFLILYILIRRKKKRKRVPWMK